MSGSSALILLPSIQRSFSGQSSRLTRDGMLWHRNHELGFVHPHHFSRICIDPFIPGQRLPIGPHMLNTWRVAKSSPQCHTSSVDSPTPRRRDVGTHRHTQTYCIVPYGIYIAFPGIASTSYDITSHTFHIHDIFYIYIRRLRMLL